MGLRLSTYTLTQTRGIINDSCTSLQFLLSASWLMLISAEWFLAHMWLVWSWSNKLQTLHLTVGLGGQMLLCACVLLANSLHCGNRRLWVWGQMPIISVQFSFFFFFFCCWVHTASAPITSGMHTDAVHSHLFLMSPLFFFVLLVGQIFALPENMFPDTRPRMD